MLGQLRTLHDSPQSVNDENIPDFGFRYHFNQDIVKRMKSGKIKFHILLNIFYFTMIKL